MFSSIIANRIDDYPCCSITCRVNEYACANPSVLTEAFRAKSRERFGKESRAPTRWLCLPYARYVLEAQIHRVVSDGKDPLILIAGQRDILRRRKRRVTHLTKQTQDRLPETLDALVHLEAQGYLCFYYRMDTPWLTVWYENPKTGWVAMLRYDVAEGRMRERLITNQYPLAFDKFLEKGAC